MGILFWIAAACGRPDAAPVGPSVSVHPRSLTLAPNETHPFSATVTGTADVAVTWSVRPSATGGTIDASGLYTAPAVAGNFSVVATEPRSGVSGEASVAVTEDCWSVPRVDRFRFFPRAGFEADMIGGAIQASSESPTNGFVNLATIDSLPAAGWNEIPLAGGAPYRYVKYFGPGTNSGSVAEVEFYDGTVLTAGLAFGTPGTPGHTYDLALDGDPATYYEGTSAVSNYVGLDLADGHVVARPTISPAGGPVPQNVTIATTTPGAEIRFTVDGSDPANGTPYTGPFLVSQAATVRAVATKSCMWRSDVETVAFTATQGSSQACMLVGNSLTDTVQDFLDPIAAAGGINLDYQKCTTPGVGTYVYHDDPACGSGVANVRTSLATTRYDHVSFQPAANMPCLPVGHAELPLGINGSDARNVEEAWNDAQGRSPAAQLWIYATWVAPASSTWANCMTGEWNRDTDLASHDHTPTWPVWAPEPSIDAATWVAATETQLRYAEAVRSWLASSHPDRPQPFVIPGGRALVNLRAAWLAGAIPGVATTENAFFVRIFGDTSADDHLVPDGEYFIALVFYAVMFQRDPRSLPDANLGPGVTWTPSQAAAIQAVVLDTVSGYALSGWGR